LVFLRAAGKKSARKTAPLVISARLSGHLKLEAQADGSVAACFDGNAVGMGRFGSAVLSRLQELRTGMPLPSFMGRRRADKQTDLLVRRLARSGFLEYRLAPARADRDLIVIEPQMQDYWPQAAKLCNSDTIVLSRFAYLRRRGQDMVLESPRSRALFRICDPKIAVSLARLASPQQIGKFRKSPGFPGMEVLTLLLDCQILFKVGSDSDDNLRLAEGDADLVLWDFHDLLFHTRSTEGRQANPVGAFYPGSGLLPLPPAVRPPWPGEKIDLSSDASRADEMPSRFSKLLIERHSTREFDDARPVTLAELARFLGCAARVRSKWTSTVGTAGEASEESYALRPYPSGGAAYELELYLTVANCDGLARGFYHYDADQHALTPINVHSQEIEAQLVSAQFAMGVTTVPQVLITITGRFGRVAWKYSSVAYSLILKDVGVLLQTLYLTAIDLGLGGCAIGTNNIDLFSKMTGLQFHVEGPVGQFALGRGKATEPEIGPAS
jgi:SagB-type dehydrogenase family enzyme